MKLRVFYFFDKKKKKSFVILPKELFAIAQNILNFCKNKVNDKLRQRY